MIARHVGAVALIAGAAVTSAGAQNRAPDLAAFDKYVAQAVHDWHTTGLAIAIVKDDSLVFARGYGVQDVRTKTAVNEHTRFAVGSTTKAMTSAAIGMLVDEGKLHFDDRVIDILPDFRLYDPWATRETTVRDLLMHRTGLPGTDLMWIRQPFTAQEMIKRLRYVKPTTSFRSTLEYQNVTYAINGAIIEKVAGMPWETFIRTRIFAPLGMNESEPLVAGIIGKANVATPHAAVGDSSRPIRIRTTDPVASAGSVYSSVADMSKWMRFILDSGRVGSQRLIKPGTFTELVTPQIRAPMELYPALQLSKPHGFSYGLGWFVQDYHGATVWMHTGSIDGMSAIIGLLPDSRMGVYILANTDHAELRHALMYRAFDMYAGNPTRDWSAELRALLARPAQTAAATQASAAAKTAPSLLLDRYVGTYVDSAYGSFEITSVSGTLHARFRGADVGNLESVQGETFRTKPASPDDDQLAVTFVIGASGSVTGIRSFGATFDLVRK
jgi:CubicO group peptidase (beta-lactamase class C family)